jgi:hypothetical protein
VIYEGQLEDIAVARSKLLARGATVRSTPVDVGDAGPVWGEAQVRYALDPDSRTIELIQLPQKTGSTS